MASNINLMDLPQEILVMTLREFFSTAEVNLIHPAYPITRGKPQPKPRSQNFLTPMLISKALQSIADEVYLEHSTFRFKGSAEARYHRVTPTEHSRQLRHISGLPDKVSLANFKMPQFRKNLPKIRSLSLRGKMPAYGTGKTDLQPHDVVVLKVLESEAISDFKALQDKFKSQGIHVTAFLDFVCPTSNHKLREKWVCIFIRYKCQHCLSKAIAKYQGRRDHEWVPSAHRNYKGGAKLLHSR